MEEQNQTPVLEEGQKPAESAKKKKHIAYMVSFGIIMALLGVILFFLTDMLNLKYWALFITWAMYVSFIVFGYTFLRTKKTWIKAVSYLGIFTLVGPMVAGGPTAEPKQAYDWDKIVYTDAVQLVHGKVRGIESKDGQTNIYTGIPYAKAPVGELRWKEPQEEENWEGVKDCIYFAPECMQKYSGAFIDSGTEMVIEGTYRPHFEYKPLEPMSEDCLYLNVYSPKGATENLPVLVYIHGGSLMTGSSSTEDYNGESLSKRGIVVVTITYRLNIFGYFAHENLIAESPNHTTGNYGLLDQIRALQWVHDNIAQFHGDPNKVTIAGESAGSSSVSALCASPRAAGLFKRAIGESSSVAVKLPPHTFRTKEKALKMGNDIMKQFGCSSIEQLRKIPAEDLVKTSYENNAMIVDGYALEKTPYEYYLEGNTNEEALLHGCNLQEADAFTIPMWLFTFQGSPNLSNYKARLKEIFKDYSDQLVQVIGEVQNDYEAYRGYNDAVSAYWFNYPDYSWGNQALAEGKTVYRYLFTKDNRYMGTWHSGEMIYCYDNIEPMKAKYPYRYDDTDVALAKTMAAYWVNFVKTGNPNGEGANIPWNAEGVHDTKVMELGSHVGMIDDPLHKFYGTMEAFENRPAEAEE